ncbi:MAG: hypothetical protein ACFE0J_13115 [Elainellaceae cyanobacterium]
MMTWIFNNTNRSILSAILFHFMVNGTGELVELTLSAEITYVALWGMLAIAIPLLTNPQTFVRTSTHL